MTFLKQLIKTFFSGRPLPFGAVYTAFGLVVLGMIISAVMFLVEHITARYGIGRVIMNAYNQPIEESGMKRQQLPGTCLICKAERQKAWRT